MLRHLHVLTAVAVLIFSIYGCSKEETTAPQKETVATPSFDPQGGAYTTAQNVMISCSTDGAVIYYTIDGDDPDESSPEYIPQQPVMIDTTTTLKARGYKSGMNPSAIAGATYVIDFEDVAAPAFSPPAGTYNTSQDVSITCPTADAQIHYTLDGSDPDESSTQYSHGSVIPITVTTTLKARAYKEGMDPSPVSSADYIIDLDDVEAPQFDPPAGTYYSIQEVTITCPTQDASIYYTLDGSVPTESSTPYTQGETITVSASILIRARAYKEGMDPSPITDALYTIDLEEVEAPQFDPPAGVYGSALDVTISCSTVDASIYYTLDESVPTESSTPYTQGEPITVGSTILIRARAFKEGMDPSPIVDAPYTIAPGLVAYYPFNGNANDESGNACHGTSHGAALAEDRNGIPNSAYYFDGIDDYIELANESNFDFREFTVVLIVRMTQLPAMLGFVSPGSYALITKGVDYGNYDISLFRDVGLDFARIAYSHKRSTGEPWTTVCESKSLYPGQYYHIALVREAAQVRIYVDGTKEYESNWVYTPMVNDEPVMIGKSPTPGSENHFNGVIDDIKVFDRSLSSSEIHKLYKIDM